MPVHLILKKYLNELKVETPAVTGQRNFMFIPPVAGGLVIYAKEFNWSIVLGLFFMKKKHTDALSRPKNP